MTDILKEKKKVPFSKITFFPVFVSLTKFKEIKSTKKKRIRGKEGKMLNLARIISDTF